MIHPVCTCHRQLASDIPDHTGMADFIQGHLGLWDGNDALIESCHCASPDVAAMAIMEMAWNRYRLLPNDR